MTNDYENLLIEFYEEKSVNIAEQIFDDSFAISPQDARNVVSPTALKNLYASEDWVFILVDRIASKISSQWLKVMEEEVVDGKKTSRPAESHPVQTLLESPNDEQDYHTFMYNLASDECLGGNAYVWRAKRNNQLLTLPFDLTTIDLGKDGSVKSYMVAGSEDLGSKSIKFLPDEICHIKRPNPSSRIYGMSPFIPGRKALLFNKYTSEYLNNFYVRGAQPGLILELNDVTNEREAVRLLRSFENAYRGRGNQRKTMIIPKGVAVQSIAHTLADQQLIEYVRNNRETIINLLQIPKHELSIAEAGSLGSEEYKIALKNFWNGQLRSIMRRIAGSLTKFFKAELGDGRYLEFDLSDVDVLQEDADKKAQLAERLLNTHTLNEVRSTLYNLDPVENGDVVRGTMAPMGPTFPGGDPFATFGTQEALSLIEQVQKGAITRDSAAEIMHSLYGVSRESVERILPAISNNSERIETKDFNVTLLRKSVGDWFEKTDQEIAKSSEDATSKLVKRSLGVFSETAVKVAGILLDYGKSTEDYETKDLPDRRELRKRIKRAIDSLEDQYLSGLTDELEATVNTGYDTALAVNFGADERERLAAIRERGAQGRRLILQERGLETFASISTSTTDQIMGVIDKGMKDNLSIRQITQSIADFFTDEEVMAGRAMTIARTEVLTAISVGQLASLRDAEKVVGPMLKMWVNAGDERVRGNPGGKYADSKADHWRLQGEVVKSADRFSNGLLLPRDLRGPANEVINCRCRMVAVSAQDAEAIGFGDLDREHTEG